MLVAACSQSARTAPLLVPELRPRWFVSTMTSGFSTPSRCTTALRHRAQEGFAEVLNSVSVSSE